MRALARPIRGLHQAAYLLAGLTLASQVLALLRDRIFAHTFGAGEVLDLYYAAFRVPDLVFALVASLVSAYVLIPRITGADRETTRRVLSESASFLFGIGGIICVILALFMPQFLALLFPNFAASAHQAEFILLARILLFQPILLGLSGVFASVTQVHRRFTLFALSPVLYNLGIIFGAIFLYPRWGLSGIGIGVIIGAVVHLAVNIPVVMEAGVIPRLRFPTFALMSSIVRDSVPRSLALGMGSVTALVLTALASRIGTGAVSVFTLAGNLEAVPLSLIGASYAVAARLTAALLVVFIVGLAAQGLVLLFSRALYAARQSWRPFLYQLAGGVLTMILAVAFLSLRDTGLHNSLATLLRVGDVRGTAVILVALAATLGQIFLVGLSLLALRTIAPGLASSLVRPLRDGCVAALLGGTATYATLALLGGIAPLTTFASVLIEGTIAGVVGCALAAAALHFIQNEEFLVMAGALNKLLHLQSGRSAVLAPSAEEPAQP